MPKTIENPALGSSGVPLQIGRPAPVGHADPDRFRTDIQALRGLAILLVLVYHARLIPQLKAGYLGVDVFFVVSGYLITGIVQRAVQAGTFTFAGFYFRRAKRLLPAAYVTLSATAIASPWFLTRPEMKDFTWQLLGAVTFTGNIALWMQTGYFEGAANLKPLLHVWSLSIEEQYYLLLPAALVFTPRRLWRIGAVAVAAASLAFCLTLVSTKPGAVFYLLPTRAWELALGSLGALVLEGSLAGKLMAKFFWPALAALLLVPFFPIPAPHPGLNALIVCLATLVVILRRHPWINQGLYMRPLAWFGDISYSLYLVHWPLLAFAANAWVSPVPGVVRLSLVCASVGLAAALYGWVEKPWRLAPISLNGQTLTVAVATSALVVLFGFGVRSLQAPVGEPDHAYLRRANVGLGSACDYQDVFTANPQCQTSESPRILVWGDSYAMHWVEGIRVSTSEGLVQATRSTCGPFAGAAGFNVEGWYNLEWARKCIRFNQDVLAYLKATPSIEVVLLGSPFGQLLPGGKVLALKPSNMAGGDVFLEVQGGNDLAANSLLETVKNIRNLGRRVILVAPPPAASGVDFGRCLELKAGGKAIWGADSPSCSIFEANYRAASQPVRRLLERVSREADVPVLQPDQWLCKAGTCVVEMDGVPLYRDNGHLGYEGSAYLGRKLGLANRLMAEAR